MNKEREVLSDWFDANKLSLNIFKTKYMLFSRFRPVQSEELFLIICNKILQLTKCITFLGLYTDGRHDWQKHTNA